MLLHGDLDSPANFLRFGRALNLPCTAVVALGGTLDMYGTALGAREALHSARHGGPVVEALAGGVGQRGAQQEVDPSNVEAEERVGQRGPTADRECILSIFGCLSKEAVTSIEAS